MKKKNNEIFNFSKIFNNWLPTGIFVVFEDSENKIDVFNFMMTKLEDKCTKAMQSFAEGLWHNKYNYLTKLPS